MPRDYYAEEIGNVTTAPVQDYYAEEIESQPQNKLQQFSEKLNATPEGRRAAIMASSLAKSPFGRLALMAMGKKPEEINQIVSAVEPQNLGGGETAIKIGSDITGSAPLFGLTNLGIGGMLPKLPSLLKLATSAGVTAGTEKAIEGKPEEAIGTGLATTAGTAALGYGGKLAFQAGKGIIKNAPQIAKGIKNIPESIRNMPDKFFRGGLTKAEAARVETEYGASNGTLVDVVKSKLNQAKSFADETYNKIFSKAPNNKFINVRPAIEEAGQRLKRLGLITENGNLTELGQSEIARDSVYGKLLDFYKSADAISGVKKLSQQESLTTGQMTKLFKADRETLVNKEQYLFLRDKINSLYKNKPSDIDVSRVADSFYQAGENSGLIGLQQARRLEREAFRKIDKFLDAKGDLKIATEQKLNRIGTDKPLSRQEMQHIEELQAYVKHPIISDANKINKLNRAKNILLKRKEQLKGAAVGGGLTYLGVSGAKKLLGD